MGRSKTNVSLIVALSMFGQFLAGSAQEPARISPEAKALLEEVSEAYSRVQSVELKGTIRSSLPTQESPEVKSSPFSSGFEAPNKFRHELEGKVIIGSTGQKAYVYQPSANTYVQGDVPHGKIGIDQLPVPIPQLLQAQNPSLLFALIKDPISMLTSNMAEISAGGPMMVNGARYLPLRLFPRQGREQITWLVEGRRINMPVLLDPQGEMAQKYHISAIPETVVIGKDGVVKKILIGSTSQTMQELREAVNTALQEYPTTTGREQRR
jgi:hypothetical protein